MKVEEAEQGSASPENASSVSSSKKRKHEEATADEKKELYLHATRNPGLKQRELAEWFELTFHKAINQSTVSRNLKKFKSSPAPIDDNNKIQNGGGPHTTPTPAKKQQQQQQQRQKQQQEEGPQRDEKEIPQKQSPTQVNVPIRSPPPFPTPPAKCEEEESPSLAELDKALYDWYSKQSDGLSLADGAIRAKAEELNTHLHPDEKSRKQLTDAWLCSWKLKHAVIQPGTPVSPEVESRRDAEDEEAAAEKSEGDSSGSGNSISSHATASPPPKPDESEEKERRKEIKKVKKEIEKRDSQIIKAKARKEELVQRLEELEKGVVAGK